MKQYKDVLISTGKYTKQPVGTLYECLLLWNENELTTHSAVVSGNWKLHSYTLQDSKPKITQEPKKQIRYLNRKDNVAT